MQNAAVVGSKVVYTPFNLDRSSVLFRMLDKVLLPCGGFPNGTTSGLEVNFPEPVVAGPLHCLHAVITCWSVLHHIETPHLIGGVNTSLRSLLVLFPRKLS